MALSSFPSCSVVGMVDAELYRSASYEREINSAYVSLSL